MMKQKLQDILQEHNNISECFRVFFSELKQTTETLDTDFKDAYKQQVHSCETSILYALGRMADTLPELDIIISAIENKKQEKEDDRKD